VGAARLAVSPHRAVGGCGSIAARSPGCAGSGRELCGGPVAVTAVALAQSAAPLDGWPGGETPASHTVTNRKPDRGWGPGDGAMRHHSLMSMRSFLGGLAQ